MKTSAQFAAATMVTLAGLAGAVLAVGSPSAADATIEKTDRFQIVENDLCQGQAWPHYTGNCLTWIMARHSEIPARTITIEVRNPESRTSMLMNVAGGEVASNAVLRR